MFFKKIIKKSKPTLTILLRIPLQPLAVTGSWSLPGTTDFPRASQSGGFTQHMTQVSKRRSAFYLSQVLPPDNSATTLTLTCSSTDTEAIWTPLCLCHYRPPDHSFSFREELLALAHDIPLYYSSITHSEMTQTMAYSLSFLNFSIYVPVNSSVHF